LGFSAHFWAPLPGKNMGKYGKDKGKCGEKLDINFINLLFMGK